MIRTVIIDDEAHNRETLAKLLERHCPEVRVAGTTDGVTSGIDIIRAFEEDVE